MQLRILEVKSLGSSIALMYLKQSCQCPEIVKTGGDNQTSQLIIITTG